MLIQGQSAIVTGGGSGLGEAVARALAAAGAKVAVLDVNAANAQRVAGDIGGVACITGLEKPGFINHPLPIERTAVDAHLRTSVRLEALAGPGFAFQHMIQGWQQGASQHDQNLKPRCKATTPSAMLKYSTFSKPTPSIIVFSSSCEGCMRIDSER